MLGYNICVYRMFWDNKQIRTILSYPIQVLNISELQQTILGKFSQRPSIYGEIGFPRQHPKRLETQTNLLTDALSSPKQQRNLISMTWSQNRIEQVPNSNGLSQFPLQVQYQMYQNGQFGGVLQPIIRPPRPSETFPGASRCISVISSWSLLAFD